MPESQKDKNVEPVDKTIAKFLKISNELERYLHCDGPLTPLQHQTIVTTIMGLHTLMQSWMRKHTPGKEQSQPFAVRPSKTPEP